MAPAEAERVQIGNRALSRHENCPNHCNYPGFRAPLAGCDKRDPVADGADNTAGLPSPDKVAGAKDGTPSVDGSAPTNVATVPAEAPAAPAAAIPAHCTAAGG